MDALNAFVKSLFHKDFSSLCTLFFWRHFDTMGSAIGAIMCMFCTCFPLGD